MSKPYFFLLLLVFFFSQHAINMEVDYEHKNELENFSIAAEINMESVGNEQIGMHNLKGDILCLCPNGLFQNPDISNIKIISKDLADWAVNWNPFKSDKKRSNSLVNMVAGLSAFFAPKLDDSLLLSITYLFFILFIFDDMMDSSQLDPLNQADIIKTTETFNDILSGKYIDLSEINYVASFPFHKPLCESMFAFLKHCSQHIADYKSKNSIFVKDIKKYFESVVIEHEYNSSIKSENNYLWLRKYTVAVKPLLEHLALVKGINLDQSIRKNLFFKRFRTAAAHAIAVTNDLFSVRKEINNAQTSNLVLVKISAKNLNLPEAFSETNNLLNKELQDLNIVGNILIKVFPKNEALGKYILMTKNAVDGHLRWYGSEVCRRYGKIKLAFHNTKKAEHFDEEMLPFGSSCDYCESVILNLGDAIAPMELGLCLEAVQDHIEL